MREKTVRTVVIGVGVTAVVGGIYNILTLPDMPETGDGIVGAVVRSVGEDYRVVLEWITTTAFVNSSLLLLVGVALILLGLNLELE
ncbi:MAG: hypothetical protein U5J64_09325 [Halobacteriales archaeon]|nr:hypothetical protein [Halobacteriales archaeon]